MFALAYTVPGFTYPIADMSRDEREWFLRRVEKQQRDERAEIDRVGRIRTNRQPRTPGGRRR